MNPLLLVLAALLSVCSGQPRFFNPRRFSVSRPPSIDQGYEVVFPTRRRNVQQFVDNTNFNFNQDSVNIMPVVGRRRNAVGGRQFGGGNFDLDTVGMIPTNQFRTPRRRIPTVRRVVVRRPTRRIERRLNRPTVDGAPIEEGYIGARGGVDGFPIFGGYCPGDMCKDGGQAAGVGNGYGPGSLSAFLERRRTGQNEDISLYERFASGPNGNSNLRNRV